MNVTAKFKIVLLLALLALTPSAWAQWLTQSIAIKPGWTAVYLHVDASDRLLDQLVGSDPANPIVEIWYWQTPSTPAQILPFQTKPATSPEWASWVRAGYTNSPAGTLNQLMPNAAYLVHSTGTTTFTWTLKGKPVPPSYAWTSSGLNFVGFPTPAATPPSFAAFLAPAPALAGWLQSSASGQHAPGIYRYPGGGLGTNNPSILPSFLWSSTPVTRGQAFWMDAGPAYNNNYFGPFQVTGLSSSSGLAFGDSASQSSFTLKNVTSSNLTVSARLLASESAPAGQVNPVGAPPVLLRGTLVATNLTYPANPLAVNGSTSWTLAPQGQPGSQLTVVIGVDRSVMAGAPGGLYAGTLQFTDSLGLSEVNVPISAQASSYAGLWVGSASITSASNFIKDYARDTNGNLIISSNGPSSLGYAVSNIHTNPGAVASAFPLRLIVHNDGTKAVLLQRVFWGLGVNSNAVVATSQAALDPAHLGAARRISSVDFPWSQSNTAWPLSGPLAPGASLSTEVDLAYDDQPTNPFLHTYHPDHDNLDATFSQELPQGAESYGVTRQITLTVSPPGNDFTSKTTVGQAFSGAYQESVTLKGLGGSTRQFSASGAFGLKRISPIATLTTQP